MVVRGTDAFEASLAEIYRGLQPAQVIALQEAFDRARAASHRMQAAASHRMQAAADALGEYFKTGSRDAYVRFEAEMDHGTRALG